MMVVTATPQCDVLNAAELDAYKRVKVLCFVCLTARHNSGDVEQTDSCQRGGAGLDGRRGRDRPMSTEEREPRTQTTGGGGQQRGGEAGVGWPRGDETSAIVSTMKIEKNKEN